MKKVNYIERLKTAGLILSVIIILTSIGFNYQSLKDMKRYYRLFTDYRDLYEQKYNEYIDEYDYWLERYKEVRKAYAKLQAYLIEQDLDYEIYTVTGYSANDPNSIQGTTDTTSIGLKTNARYMNYLDIVAVDPKVIPYGSVVIIKSDWEHNGYIYDRLFIAGDCGGMIIGKHIDILFGSKKEAQRFGLQALPVKVIKKED